MATPNTIAKTALLNLGVFDPEEPLGATDASTCLDALKSILDALNLDPLAVIGRQEVTRTPVAGTQSFTIGTGGDVSTVGMPLRIESAFYRSNGVDVPVGIASLEEYLGEATKTVRGQPEYIAYERGYSTGTVYLYPAADGASELHLWILRDAVSGYASLTTTTTLTLPNGYQNALEWALADEVSASYNALPDKVAMAARKAATAMRRIKRANTRVSELQMPCGVASSGSFNINQG